MNCDARPEQPASEHEMYVATEVGKLIAFGTSGGALDREALREFDKALKASEGTRYAVLRYAATANISYSVVSRFLRKPRVKLSLPTAVSFCAANGFCLVDMAQGRLRRQAALPGYVRAPKVHATLNVQEITAAVETELRSTRPRALAHLCKELGYLPATVSKKLPELTKALTLVVRARIIEERNLTKAETERRAVRAISMLKREGLPLTINFAARVDGEKGWHSRGALAEVFMRLREGGPREFDI